MACNDNGTKRSPLVILLSVDYGVSWKYRRILESGSGQYGYTSVIQTKDGKIHVAYDIDRYSVKHIVVDEAWFNPIDKELLGH